MEPPALWNTGNEQLKEEHYDQCDVLFGESVYFPKVILKLCTLV